MDRKIIFSDGRKGIQTTDDDGNLTEILVTVDADGNRVRQVYSRKPDLMARVYSLADLGNVTWQLADVAEVR